MRITGDNDEGKAQLDNFIDPERALPGHRHDLEADDHRRRRPDLQASSCSTRRIQSMTEFKQIIGRGTRIEDYGKFFFTIIDFRKATELFADPDFDGPPIQIYEVPEGDDDVTSAGSTPDDEPIDDEIDDDPRRPRPRHRRRRATRTTIAHVYVVSGVTFTVRRRARPVLRQGRQAHHRVAQGLHAAAPCRRSSRRSTTSCKRWNDDRPQAGDRRRAGRAAGAARGAARTVGKDLDPFDLICHVAFDQPPLTRRERADNVRKRDVLHQVRRRRPARCSKPARQVRRRGRRRASTRSRCSSSTRSPTLGTPDRARPNGSAARTQYLAAVRELDDRPVRTRLSSRSQPCPSRTTIKSIQDIMRKDAGVDGDAQRIGQLGWMLFLKIFDDLEIETELEDDDYESPDPAAPALERLGRRGPRRQDAPTGDELLDFVNNDLFPTLKDLDVAQFTGKARAAGRAAAQRLRGRLQLHEVRHADAPGHQQDQPDIDFNESTTRHLFGDIYEQILRDLQSAGNAGEFYTPARRDPVRRRHGRPAARRDRARPRLRHRRLPHLRHRAHAQAGRDRRRRSSTQLKASIRGVEKKPLPHLLCVTNMMLHGIEVPTSIRHDNTLARPLRDYGPKDQVDVIVTNPPFGGMEEDGIENNFPAEFRTRETADLFLVLVMELLKDGGRAAIVLPDGTLFGEGIKTRIKEKLLEECNLHTIVRLPKGVFAPYTSIKTNLLFFTKGEPTKDVWFYEHPYPEGYKSYSKTKPMRIEEFEPEKEWWDEPRRRPSRPGRSPLEDIKAAWLQPRHQEPERRRRRPRGPRRPARPLRRSHRRGRSRPRSAPSQPRRSPPPRLMDAQDLPRQLRNDRRRSRRRSATARSGARPRGQWTAWLTQEHRRRARSLRPGRSEQSRDGRTGGVPRASRPSSSIQRARRSTLLVVRRWPDRLACAYRMGVAPLAAVAQLESGHTPDRKVAEYWDGQIPWIGIAQMPRIVTATSLTTENARHPSRSRQLVGTATPHRHRVPLANSSVGYCVVMGSADVHLPGLRQLRSAPLRCSSIPAGPLHGRAGWHSSGSPKALCISRSTSPR